MPPASACILLARSADIDGYACVRTFCPFTSSLLAAWLALGASPCAGEVELRIEADGSLVLSDTRTTPAAPGSGAGTAPKAPGARATALDALPFATLVAEAAAEHAIAPELIHAVIRAESNYDASAVSPRGAVGLMQLMPATARELGVSDAANPAANIRGGARYLKRLLERFDDDIALALAAYNAGPGAVLRSGRAIPAFAETRRYVPRVVAEYRRLKALAIGGASPATFPTIGDAPR